MTITDITDTVATTAQAVWGWTKSTFVNALGAALTFILILIALSAVQAWVDPTDGATLGVYFDSNLRFCRAVFDGIIGTIVGPSTDL